MEESQLVNDKGLLLVMTGNGKGKTTASLGLAFRALGHGFPVCMIQFIKGSWKYGELTAANRFGDLFEIHVMGRGFTWKSDNPAKDVQAARKAWEFAAEIIGRAEHRLVILDELTYLVTYNMVPEQEILQVLGARPKSLHVAVTGRGASPGLLSMADLVTEMVDLKHPYKAGIKAQRGIEF